MIQLQGYCFMATIKAARVMNVAICFVLQSCVWRVAITCRLVKRQVVFIAKVGMILHMPG